MPVTVSNPAPYAPPSAILEIVERYRGRGLPSPIGPDVLGRSGISDSLIPRTIQALKVLDLIDEDGRPTPTLDGLRLAPESEYKQRIGQWLSKAYADVLNYIDPANADETDVRDAFRNYKPVGQQSRMVTLFVGLYAAAGIGLERSIPARVRRARATSNDASSTRRSLVSPIAPSQSPTPAPSKMTGDQISDKALEYKLVDLLKNEDVGEEHQTAIWTLIQYLANRSKSAAA